MNHIPPAPENSYRITLEITSRAPRMDSVLIQALRNQNDIPELKTLSREQFKKLFKEKRVLIKDQIAHPSSGLAKGITYVDILGYSKQA